MTKLEEEMMDALWGNHDMPLTRWEKAAVEVAKKYIEKAYSAGMAADFRRLDAFEMMNKWLKENGITE